MSNDHPARQAEDIDLEGGRRVVVAGTTSYSKPGGDIHLNRMTVSQAINAGLAL